MRGRAGSLLTDPRRDEPHPPPHEARVAEPLHHLCQNLRYRALRPTHLVDGFGGTEEHLLQRHPYTVQGTKRGRPVSAARCPRPDGPPLVYGEKPQPPTRSGKAGDSRQFMEQASHRPIPLGVTQNVAFADTSSLGSQHVPRGHTAYAAKLNPLLRKAGLAHSKPSTII